jgi:hypothetical protein
MDIGRMWYHYPFVVEIRKKWEKGELERASTARWASSALAVRLCSSELATNGPRSP